MISAAFISAMIGNTLPGHGSIYLSQTLKFRAPVRPGDVVRVELEVLDYDAEQARRRGSRRARSSATCSSWTARPRSSRRAHVGAGRSGGARTARAAPRDRARRAGVRAPGRNCSCSRCSSTSPRARSCGSRDRGSAARTGRSARASPCPLQLPPGDRVLEPRDRAGRHPRRAADLPLGAPGGRPRRTPALGRRRAAHVRTDPARCRDRALRPQPAARDEPLPGRRHGHGPRRGAARAALGGGRDARSAPPGLARLRQRGGRLRADRERHVLDRRRAARRRRRTSAAWATCSTRPTSTCASRRPTS